MTQNVFLTSVAPALGVVTSNLMYASPIRAVLKVRRDGKIGVSPPPLARPTRAVLKIRSDGEIGGVIAVTKP